MLSDAYELYREAPPTIRRQLNQTVWGRFRVSERDVWADLALPFAVLLGPVTGMEPGDVTGAEGSLGSREDDDHEKKNRVPILGRGSNFTCLVAGRGFEPLTSGL